MKRRIYNLRSAKEALDNNFDREKLRRLIDAFLAAVKRRRDVKLGMELKTDFLNGAEPDLRSITLRRLAKWCRTDRIYADGMQVALQISELLFGQILDRDLLHT